MSVTLTRPTLPGYVKPIVAPKSTTSSRATVNKVSESSRASSKTVNLAAQDAPLRIIYGNDVLGGLIANVLYHNAKWCIQSVWGEGEIDSIQSVQFSNEPVSSGSILTHYTGASTQTVNSALVAAFAAQSLSYSDSLPGIAYSVIQFSPSAVSSFPNITATVKGLKVFDPRSSLWTYSTNPALQLADFLTNPVYGRGESVIWSSVAIAADYCDELIGGVKRRECGVSFSTKTDSADIVETLRTYAGVWLIKRSEGYAFGIDRPSSVVRSFDHALGQIESLERIRRRPYYDAPTRVQVRYTNTTTLPWIEETVKAELPGIPESQHRDSIINLPGIQNRAQAQREAIERLNKLALLDLTCEMIVADENLDLEYGDVIAVTHPIGFSAKEFRIVGISILEAGQYLLSLEEYSSTAYSDIVQEDDGPINTILPLPSEPIPPSGLLIDEEVFQLLDGSYSSRFRVSWTAPEFPFIAQYRITLSSGGKVVFSGTAPANAVTWASPAVQEDVSYQIDIQTISLTSAVSDAISGNKIALGKFLIPSDVPSLIGFEVGGEVRLSWTPAIDRDTLRYEVRYGAVGVSWNDAKVIDTVDALRLVTKDVPAGDWDFLVKAIDSVFQESTNPARRTITVTVDANSFLVDTAEFESPITSGMLEYKLGRLDSNRYFVTEDNSTIGSKLSGSLSSYTKPLSAYNSIASSYQTESYDFGLLLSGNWSSELSHFVIDGSSSPRMELSTNGVDWNQYAEMVAKANGRFVRLKVTSVSGSSIRVKLPVASVRIDAIPREETGTATSLASGPKRIYLDANFLLAKSIQITPSGTTAVNCVWDNVTLGGSSDYFDVYCFNAAGTQVAKEFFWTFNGV